MPLRVLITNIEIWSHTGTPLYVIDLARELRRQGHWPAVYTLSRGKLAKTLEREGIVVTANARQIPWRPDIIHGHHHSPTLSALAHWPGVPAIFVSHTHDGVDDLTPAHPRIRRYFGVSRVCVDRVRRDLNGQVPVEFLSNFVDLNRFRLRLPLPRRPTRALVFSNYARAGTHLPAIREACARAGLSLDVVGAAVGNQNKCPEGILGNYDLIFAKAKAAMEAMATGVAVVLCDFKGSGPMVRSQNFERLRGLNFGFESLSAALAPEPLLAEIARYDSVEASLVSKRMRAEMSLTPWTQALVACYEQVVAEEFAKPSLRAAEPLRPPLMRKRVLSFVGRQIGELNPRIRARLEFIPGYHTLKRFFVKVYRA